MNLPKREVFFMIETQSLTQTERQGGKEELRHSEFGAIALVTDFGDDLAKAECRLALNVIFNEHRVIVPDLIAVNDVVSFNKVHAAFNLCRLANMAGPKTVFIGVVDPGVGTDRKGIILQTDREHYFVGPDNGIFYPAASEEGITGIWSIDESLFPTSANTFHGRDIFSKVAARIACGFDPSTLGEKADNLVKLHFQSGQILHIDRYGNLKVNLNVAEEGNKIVLHGELEIPFLRTFEDVEVGQPLAYLGSSGLLEIAIREGNAAKILGYNIGDCLEL